MDRQADFERFKALIKDIRVCMMTTVEDGTLVSRPMATIDQEFTGELWFFTRMESEKVDELEQDQHVNLSYANPASNVFISVCGTGTVVHDRRKARDLWNPLFKAWFQNGPDDPQLALIRVDVHRAEFWDAPASPLVKVVAFAKAMVGGREYRPGEHHEVTLAH